MAVEGTNDAFESLAAREPEAVGQEQMNPSSRMATENAIVTGLFFSIHLLVNLDIATQSVVKRMIIPMYSVQLKGISHFPGFHRVDDIIQNSLSVIRPSAEEIPFADFLYSFFSLAKLGFLNNAFGGRKFFG